MRDNFFILFHHSLRCFILIKLSCWARKDTKVQALANLDISINCIAADPLIGQECIDPFGKLINELAK